METLTKVELAITSSAFKNGKKIPVRYSCEGSNASPPINFGNVPKETESIAIIMDDVDAAGGNYNHWVAWNIPPFEPLDENAMSGIAGMNSAGGTGYSGPCPSSGKHTYEVKVFALDAELHLVAGSDADELMNAMDGHILATGVLTGTFEKKQ